MSDKPELTPERRAEIANQVRAALRRPRPTMADHVANQKSFWLPLLADKHQFSAGLISRLDAASRKLTALEQLADSGSAPLKFDLVLSELQHLQTIYQWNTDPDTILGEKNMHGVSMGARLDGRGRTGKAVRQSYKQRLTGCTNKIPCFLTLKLNVRSQRLLDVMNQP